MVTLVSVFSPWGLTLPMDIGQTFTSPLSKRPPTENDFTLAVSINLKDKLVLDEERKRPVPCKWRTFHTWPNQSEIMQDEFDNLLSYSEVHRMKINSDKTKAILFNSRRNPDFSPQLHLTDFQIGVVEEVKLLGDSISSDLRWTSNTECICSNEYRRLWFLGRLMALGANQEELVDALDSKSLVL